MRVRTQGSSRSGSAQAHVVGNGESTGLRRRPPRLCARLREEDRNLVYDCAAAYQDIDAVDHLVTGQTFESDVRDNLETLRLVVRCDDGPATGPTPGT